MFESVKLTGFNRREWLDINNTERPIVSHSLGGTEVSEMTIYDKGKNKGFLSILPLVSFAVLALPCLVLGAGRASGMSGGFRVSRSAGQQTGFALGAGRTSGSLRGFSVARPGVRQTRLHGFHRRGFFVGDGFFGGDGGVTVTAEQEPQATVTMQPQQPVHKGRYVQPRWVDGGYGVQVSEPGYWTDN
jgi:hypothetical protein